MSIDKNKIKTQEEMGEEAPMDQVDKRVEAEMKQLEGTAKRDVAEGLNNEQLAREGERLAEEGKRDLDKVARENK